MTEKAAKAFAPDELKKKIETLKGQLAAQKEWKSPEARTLRKQLKRAQRRLAVVAPGSLEDRSKRLTKVNESIGKILSDLSKTMKKPQNNPHIHSLRKATKSLNKRVKKLNRLIERKKPKDAPAAPAAPASAPS